MAAAHRRQLARRIARQVLAHAAGLRGAEIAVATLFPLTLIVAGLAVLNLDRAVFDLMGGRTSPSADDAAYVAVLYLTFVSMCLLPFVLAGYAYFVWARLKQGPAVAGT